MSGDPYRFFRIEARELADQLGVGVLELERAADPPDAVARMLRAAHTLKGAARVVKQTAMADDVHALEDALTPYRHSAGPVPAEETARLLALVDAINAGIAALPGPQAAAPGVAPARAPAAAVADPPAVVRIDAADVDDLLDAVGEAQAHLAPVRRAIHELDRIRRGIQLLMAQLDGPTGRGGTPGDRTAIDVRIRSIATGLGDDLAAAHRHLARSVEHGERELHQIRTSAEQLRLVPAASIFPALHRAVRDAAAATGTSVGFEATGGATRLDPAVLSAVYGALLHIVRNAVAHGIESPQQRRSAGKPAEGRVQVEVTRDGTQVVFSCRDDGRGVDVDAVRDTAARAGLLGPDSAAISAPELTDLLLHGGISTAGSVTELSGRGVGLDAARDAAHRLGGRLSLDSVPGRGTTVRLTVPLSLLSVDCLLVEVAGATATIPLDSVRQCLRLRDAEPAQAASTTTVRYEDRTIPFLPMAPAFAQRGAGPASGPAFGPAFGPASGPTSGPAFGQTPSAPAVAVVVSASSDIAAIGVDRVLGTAPVVVRAIPALAPAGVMVGGLSLDGQGDPRVVLDPAGLVAAATRGGAGSQPRRDPDRPRRPVLVIDDSVTTRMLERSILESAGYDVDVASSGEEALGKARATVYGLFLVDIEMPGMDGFTFIEHTKADPALRDIPAILVSSRASAEDRERGVQVGAAMHVAKGAFNQNELLDHIRKLVN